MIWNDKSRHKTVPAPFPSQGPNGNNKAFWSKNKQTKPHKNKHRKTVRALEL